MCVVGVGLAKVYKALLRRARGASFVPFLMSLSEAFSVLFHFNKILPKSSNLVPGPDVKSSSSEITNPTSFTISYGVHVCVRCLHRLV